MRLLVVLLLFFTLLEVTSAYCVYDRECPELHKCKYHDCAFHFPPFHDAFKPSMRALLHSTFMTTNSSQVAEGEMKSPAFVTNLNVEDFFSWNDMDVKQRRDSMQTSSASSSTGGGCGKKKDDHCAFGVFHLHTGMKILVVIGSLAIIGILTALFMVFKKAIFVLLIPTAVTVLTLIAIIARVRRLVWPIIAISFFHVILALYAALIFAFFFFFKPFFIMMVLNWAFDSEIEEQDAEYYSKCAGFAFIVIVFGLFNSWQAATSVRYMEWLHRITRGQVVAMEDSASNQHMILVVNKSVDYRPANEY